MKKIKLDLDDLKVESFTTTPDDEATVQGYSCPTCGQATCSTCEGQVTCDATCPETCAPTDCSCPIASCETTICH